MRWAVDPIPTPGDAAQLTAQGVGQVFLDGIVSVLPVVVPFLVAFWAIAFVWGHMTERQMRGRGSGFVSLGDPRGYDRYEENDDDWYDDDDSWIDEPRTPLPQPYKHPEGRRIGGWTI